jgi:hypothetical protein
MKYAVTHIESTEDIYGYSAIAIPLTPENQAEIKRLRVLINAVKVLGAEIDHIEIMFPKITSYPLNDEFEADENDVIEQIEFSPEDWEKFTNFDEITCKVESAILTVGIDGFNLTYSSKWTSDTLWSGFSFDEMEKLFEENLVVTK